MDFYSYIIKVVYILIYKNFYFYLFVYEYVFEMMNNYWYLIQCVIRCRKCRVERINNGFLQKI